MENQSARTPDASSLAEVLDRILDKGIVIDVWARVSVVGIEILTVEARVVVASVDTFIHYAENISKIEQASQSGDIEDLDSLDTDVGAIEPRAVEVEES
jgi:hypothetical protein